MKILDHRRVRLLALDVLLFENRGGRARASREKEQQVVLEVEQGLLGDFQWRGFHAAIWQKTKAGDTTIGRDILVLFANWFAQFLELDAAGLLRQLGRMHQVLLQGVKGFEQRGRKASRRAQPRARRDIGHAGDLKVPLVDVNQPQRLPDNRMLDFTDRGRLFQLGIFEEETFSKPAVDIDVDIFVDRGRN